MFLDILVQNFWLSMSLWFALMVADNLLSIIAVRMYRNGACKHIVLDDGSELNPLFKDDVANNRMLSPQFMLVLACGYIAGWILWSYGVHSGHNPHSYEFFTGMLLLLQLPIQLRHGRTILLYSHLKDSQGVKGRIKYDSWLSHRLQSIEYLAFSLIFLAAAAAVWRVFFMGGAVSCGLMAFTTWRAADTLPSSEEQENEN